MGVPGGAKSPLEGALGIPGGAKGARGARREIREARRGALEGANRAPGGAWRGQDPVGAPRPAPGPPHQALPRPRTAPGQNAEIARTARNKINK